MEERFTARLKLAELPRNSQPDPHPQPVRESRAVRAPIYRKLKMSRIALRELGSHGRDPGPRQVELVRRTTMAMNDPIGDMLTRIRNAQMRRKTQGLDARLAAARARPRRAAVGRLHPRLHAPPSTATAAPSSKSS